MKFTVAVITWDREEDLLKYLRTWRDEDADPEYAKRYEIEAETTEGAAKKLTDGFLADGGKVIKTEDIGCSYIVMPDKRVYESVTVYYTKREAMCYSIATLYGLWEDA